MTKVTAQKEKFGLGSAGEPQLLRGGESNAVHNRS